MAGFSISRRSALMMGAGGLLLAARPSLAFAQSPEPEIDSIVGRFMSEFEMPGIGVAVVRPNQPAFVRGYGVRALGRPERVDGDTQFAIASNSKAFLSAALAILVDEGKLGWDDPVIKHVPEFRMFDPAVTQMMTVRDLLVHRSGLPLGAGDLMQFPKSDHSREDILRGLQYMKPEQGFRTAYAYDNSLYIVAGIVLERVSGQSWDRFIPERIFRPLGMTRAVTNPTLARPGNLVARHARLGPPTRGIGPVEVIPPDETAVIGPAGGIVVSPAEIVPWLQVQLARGALPGGGRLFSEAQADEMWKAQTITASTAGPTADMPSRPVLQAYALGWLVNDYRGRRMLSHSGGLSGQVTYTVLIPSEGIGFVVYSNTEDGTPVSGLRYAILDHLLGAPAFDWAAATRKNVDRGREQVMKLAGNGEFAAPPGGPSLPLAAYAGRYRDAWYGDVVVARRGQGLHIDFTRTLAFKSMLEPFGPDAFRTRFPRGAGEDAVVTFAVENGAVTGVKMKALSPLADFSYDFHDLDLKPVR